MYFETKKLFFTLCCTEPVLLSLLERDTPLGAFRLLEKIPHTFPISNTKQKSSSIVAQLRVVLITQVRWKTLYMTLHII